ncbi:hypothetical protein OF83DRAFT_1086003 [Amylostereum chailletii]|nr:hypothetical protein OF83DRAFT_1086003 [Amylostereum chailletii]
MQSLETAYINAQRYRSRSDLLFANVSGRVDGDKDNEARGENEEDEGEHHNVKLNICGHALPPSSPTSTPPTPSSLETEERDADGWRQDDAPAFSPILRLRGVTVDVWELQTGWMWHSTPRLCSLPDSRGTSRPTTKMPEAQDEEATILSTFSGDIVLIPDAPRYKHVGRRCRGTPDLRTAGLGGDGDGSFYGLTRARVFPAESQHEDSSSPLAFKSYTGIRADQARQYARQVDAAYDLDSRDDSRKRGTSNEYGNAATKFTQILRTGAHARGLPPLVSFVGVTEGGSRRGWRRTCVAAPRVQLPPIYPALGWRSRWRGQDEDLKPVSLRKGNTRNETRNAPLNYCRRAGYALNSLSPPRPLRMRLLHFEFAEEIFSGHVRHREFSNASLVVVIVLKDDVSELGRSPVEHLTMDESEGDPAIARWTPGERSRLCRCNPGGNLFEGTMLDERTMEEVRKKKSKSKSKSKSKRDWTEKSRANRLRRVLDLLYSGAFSPHPFPTFLHPSSMSGPSPRPTRSYDIWEEDDDANSFLQGRGPSATTKPLKTGSSIHACHLSANNNRHRGTVRLSVSSPREHSWVKGGRAALSGRVDGDEGERRTSGDEKEDEDEGSGSEWTHIRQTEKRDGGTYDAAMLTTIDYLSLTTLLNVCRTTQSLVTTLPLALRPPPLPRRSLSRPHTPTHNPISRLRLHHASSTRSPTRSSLTVSARTAWTYTACSAPPYPPRPSRPTQYIPSTVGTSTLLPLPQARPPSATARASTGKTATLRPSSTSHAWTAQTSISSARALPPHIVFEHPHVQFVNSGVHLHHRPSAYKVASDVAVTWFLPTPRSCTQLMGLYYEVLNYPTHVCLLAKQAFNDTISELDTPSEEADSERTTEDRKKYVAYKEKTAQLSMMS